MADISILQLIILILIPMSQLYARIFWLNGSLDKPWLLIFSFPPFSIIPAIMIKMGWVKDGEGGIPPYDYWMLIPIICKLLIGFLVEKYFDDSTITISIVFLIQLIASIIPNYIRAAQLCNLSQTNLFNTNLFTKSITDGIIENSVANIVPVILTYLPFVGMFFSVLEYIPVIGSSVNQIIWSLCYAATYIVLNMVNTIDLKKYCNASLFGNTSDQVAAIILSIISYFLTN